MNKATNKLYGADASRRIDAHAIAHLGVSGYALMQRAADSAFACLLQNFPGVKSVSICCGKGNNAGDAYLLARLALLYGINTQVLAVVDPVSLSGDAERAHADALAAGVEVTAAAGLLPTEISGDVIVDGLLGTGLNGPPREPFASFIAMINESHKKVLSIDLPSGVSADTGAVYTQGVCADVTISFITRKIGLYTGQGVSYAGIRVFDDLGIAAPPSVADGVPLFEWNPQVLPELDANTYKHRQGHVVIAGGDSGMPGAVAMAAEAALRVGAGMVTVATRAQHAAAIIARTPEVMVLAADHADAVLADADFIVLGPGLGKSDWSKAVYSLAEETNKPVVVDADGLYWLAQAGAWRGGSLVITPHIAEAARLLDSTSIEVQQDRVAACTQLRERYQCQGVLKGSGSVVFSAHQVAICAHGNPGMATAGMGDVLSGILGGLLAAVDTAEQAAMLLSAGVALHSAAADEAAHQSGQRSLLATDVIAALPRLLCGFSASD